MSETPLTPRERMLREAELEQAEQAAQEDYFAAQADPIVQHMAEAAEAAAQARAAGPITPEEVVEAVAADDEEEGLVEAPEILTLQELEAQLARLDHLAEHAATIPPGDLNLAADDALQGVAVILGMGFVGDVQMMVMAALQRYREIKRYR